LKIARMGHPVLARRADRVSDPTAPEIARLIANMWETLADAGGIGLAAPQVHVPLRIVVFALPAKRMAAAGEADAAGVPPTVLINPEIVPLAPTMAADWEACLSLPGLAGRVKRFTQIRFSGYDLDGARIERRAEGLLARVVQHECDHLDGILYPMRIENLREFGFVPEVRRAAALASDRGEATADL
jgi:peptide deformylase